MTSIQLELNGAMAKAETSGILTAGMVGIPVSIQYDDEWEELTKSLVCQSDAGCKVVLDVGTDAVIPPEVMRWVKNGRNQLFVGVEGRNADGSLVIPSAMAYCGEILSSADPGKDTAIGNAEKAWEKTLSKVKVLEEQWKDQLEATINDVIEQSEIHGGYYLPEVSQEDDRVNVEFKASETYLPQVPEVSFLLAEGKDGANGKDGADGKSAYQIWLAAGNTGDEAAFLASLKGAKGDKGDTGAKGATGATGATGAKGDKGDTGATGPQGPKGEKGDTGAVGPQGVAGATGAPGADGKTPVRGTDYWTEEDKAEINGDSQSFIVTELAKRGQLTPEFANDLSECTDTTKLYVLPDGYIYGYLKTEVAKPSEPLFTNQLPKATDASGSPYNGGLGYKEDYRVSSSNAEKAASGYDCTGYIPCSSKSVIRIKNVEAWKDGNNYCTIVPLTSSNAVMQLLYGSDYTADSNGVWTVDLSTLNNSPAKFRLTAIGITSNTIITVDEEIKYSEATTTTGYQWANTGHAFVPADYENRIADLEIQSAACADAIAKLNEGDVQTDDITKWDAPIYDGNIMLFRLPAEKTGMTNAACTPADIYAKYDALMEKYPHYITKRDMGLCSDGVNHIYRYDFCEPEPRHTSGLQWSETKKKAIIVSGVHYEWAGIYGLYYAMEEIAENPELYHFRRNSHLIVVPCINPYATIASNYSDSVGVKNANGVEIHRNFEVGWVLTDAGTTHYGGTEPLSEVETRYVNDIMKENTDAILFLSCHSFSDTGFNFIWPSTATPYMCNMGYRLIDKMSHVWMEKYGDELIGLEDYRTENIPSWDNRFGFAHISQTPGTEVRQGTKYGIQSANVEINDRFWVHGTPDSPELSMSTFTMSRGAEVYVNFLLTAFGVDAVRTSTQK